MSQHTALMLICIFLLQYLIMEVKIPPFWSNVWSLRSNFSPFCCNVSPQRSKSDQKHQMFDLWGQIFHLFAAMFHLKGQNPTQNIKCLIAEVKFFTFLLQCFTSKVKIRSKTSNVWSRRWHLAAMNSEFKGENGQQALSPCIWTIHLLLKAISCKESF